MKPFIYSLLFVSLSLSSLFAAPSTPPPPPAAPPGFPVGELLYLAIAGLGLGIAKIVRSSKR